MTNDENEQLYSVSDAAALSGCSAGTLRQYIADGLLKVRRDSRGSRLFTLANIEAAKQIYEARLARHGRTGRRGFVVISTSTGG